MLHTEIIHSSPTTALYGFDKATKAGEILQTNVLVNARGLDEQTQSHVADSGRKIGFSPIDLDTVFYALSKEILEKNITLPEGKKNKKERGQVIDDLLSNLQLSDAANEETEKKSEFETDNQESIREMAKQLSEDSSLIGRVTGYLKSKIEEKKGYLVIQKQSSNSNGFGVKITAETSLEQANQGNNYIDHAITSRHPDVVKFGVMRATLTQTMYRVRRNQIRESIANGETKLVPKFDFHDWPVDHMMQSLRSQVTQKSNDFIRENNFVCDAQDLKYQTLFRLTTFPVAQVFEDGDRLQNYLDSIGYGEHWTNILKADPNIVSQFEMRTDLADLVINEQAKIIEDRLKNSDLPINEILTPTGIFAEPGWVIARRNGDVFAVQEEGSANTQAVPLELKPVDLEYAKKIHHALHYIHTPRADLAFGLFVKGEENPFSVLALEKIDRPYKQNVLLARGYDPRRCYDLTRLYSKPGTPGNTSSSIFALTFKYIREHNPEIQAIVSAFMPSYATGVSMTSGGFDKFILIKNLRHSFGATRTSDGSIAYEHLTRRRQTNAIDIVASQFPLLPTIELMTQIREPRFEPLPGVDENMFEITY